VVEGAIVFAAGLLTGVILPYLPRRRRHREPRPLCQCRHPRALHDPGTNACHDRVPKYAGSSAYVQCPCRQYVGPEPLPAVFSTGLEMP
jgi:hypothetical protein